MTFTDATMARILNFGMAVDHGRKPLVPSFSSYKEKTSWKKVHNKNRTYCIKKQKNNQEQPLNLL